MPSGASALKYGSRIPTNWRSLKKQINAFSFVEINKLKENINKRGKLPKKLFYCVGGGGTGGGTVEGVRRRGTEEGYGGGVRGRGRGRGESIKVNDKGLRLEPSALETD